MTDSTPNRANLRGFETYAFESADELISFADSRKGILVAVNAEKLANGDAALIEVANANIAYTDGGGAVQALRRRGYACNRIAGCELWLNIIERFHGEKSFYLVGAAPEVNAETVEKLRKLYPDLQIVGARDGFLRSEAETEALIDDIAATAPDVVFVAMGSPKQELLMARMLRRHKAIYQGLGGSFDVFTGRVQRAPRWWREHNLEFAYRFYAQPRRIVRIGPYVKFAWWLLTKQI